MERSLFDSHPDAVFEFDTECVLVHMNPAACRMLARGVDDVIGAGLDAIAAPECLESDLQQLRATLGGEARIFDSIGVASTGRRVRVQVTSIPQLDDGRVSGLYAIVKNVDAERRIHEQLAASEARLRALVEHSMDAVLLSDPREGRMLECNRAAEELFGRSEAQLRQCSREQVFDLEMSDFSEFIRQRDDTGNARGILYLIRPDGRRIPVEASSAMFQDGLGQWRSSVTLHDISEQRQLHRQVDFLSYNGGLTALPNLAALQQWFSDGKPRSEARGHLAVVYLDLDRFKAINESFGHSTGDEVLIEVGRRLYSHCNKADFLARLGGDDFIIVFTGLDNASHAQTRTEQLIGRLAEPMNSSGQRIFSSASAGIVFCPDGDGNIEDLLRRADAAHASAKSRGRGQVQLYDHSMQREVEEHALVETHLREAIRQGELYLVHQPVVDLHDGRIVGLEVLVRWNNPELGDVPPARFIPVAEESGLIVELGARIFEQACAEVRRWLDTGVAFGSLSVNISPAQFQQRDFPDRIAQSLAEHGLGGEHFVIEITESVLMIDPERATEILHRLRGLGLRIAVDDFGTGYSSLAYLRQFPVQCIKLDRAFIRTAPDSEIDSAIIRSVIDLARALGIYLIAEGIENARQREALVEWGCTVGQGFLFSKPCRIAGINEMLRAEWRAANESPDVPHGVDPIGEAPDD